MGLRCDYVHGLNLSRPSVYRYLMRHLLLLLLLVDRAPAPAQRLDPDQNPYWARYTLVEDSSVLIPLQGDYRVYYLQSGMWWNMTIPQYPIRHLPEVSMRLSPLFEGGLPAFRATPARGLDHPDVRLVVVKGRDTMVVELSTYWALSSQTVDDRCARTDCRRRPPLILPFRPGRYIGNGAPYGPDGTANPDPRTTELTREFDELWKIAMKEERVIKQLTTDTCEQVLSLPPPLEPAKTPMRDVWVMRSPYCGTHHVHFPAVSVSTEYIITFHPYFPEQTKDPVHIRVRNGAHSDDNVDVTAWPIGDHPVRLLVDGQEETFTLKLR